MVVKRFILNTTPILFARWLENHISEYFYKSFGEGEYLQGYIEDIPETIKRPVHLDVVVRFVQVVNEERGMVDFHDLDHAIGFKIVPLTPEQTEVVISVGSQLGEPYSSFDFYIEVLLADVRRYWPDVLEQTEPLSDADGHQCDVYSCYIAGLQEFRNRVKQSHPRYLDILTYDQRLRENIDDSQLYGDTQERKADRSQIIRRLNELSLSVLHTPFMDLCRLNTSTMGREPSPEVADERVGDKSEN